MSVARPRRIAATLVGAFAIALVWPNVPMASAAPAVVRASVRSELARDAGRAPIRFHFVGATWSATETPSLDVRTSVDGTTWSEWETLGPDDTGPDRNSEGDRTAVHSSPVYIGEASYVQTRGAGTLELLNVRGNARDLPAPVRALRSLGRWASTARPAGAATPAGPVGIYTRAQWGADERLRNEAPEYATTNRMAFIHHTDGTNSYAAGEVPSIIRGIYYYHTKVRGYKDIAYNFLVDRFGRTWEGRWGGMDKTVIGGHTAGLNSGSIGVAMLGMHDSLTPSAGTQNAIVNLLTWKFTIHKILPRSYARMTVNNTGARWPSGTTVSLNTISGHRDAVATACPGNAGYATLGGIRSRVHARVLPAGSFANVAGTIWLFTGTGRRNVPNKQVLGTLVPESEILSLHPNEVTTIRYEGRIGFRDGTLVRADNRGTVYLVSGGTLHPFRSATDFDAMRFSWSRIIVTWGSFLSTLPVKESVDPKRYLDGVALRASGSSAVSILRDGKLASVPSGAVLTSLRYAGPDVIVVPAQILAPYQKEGVVKFRDGTIIKGSGAAVYVISGGMRRPFRNPGVFAELGYAWADVKTVADWVVNLHPQGAPVDIQSG